MAAQPIKQSVKAGSVKDMPHYTMCVDGTNLLNIACQGDKEHFNKKGDHTGGIYQFFMQLHVVMNLVPCSQIYVFWDGKMSGLLRYNIYKDYKKNRDKIYCDKEKSSYEEFMDAFVANVLNHSSKKKNGGRAAIDDGYSMSRQKNIIISILEDLYVRQPYDSEEITESDDMIAYYCQHKRLDEKIVIVSSDRDLTQLISQDISIYIPVKKKYIRYDNFNEVSEVHYSNIVLEKIICGDVSDNIKGISGVGKKTILEIMPEIKNRKVELSEFLERVKELKEKRLTESKKPLIAYENILNCITDGIQKDDIYEINRKIIDLKYPLLSESAIRVMDEYIDSPIDPNGRTKSDAIRRILPEDIFEWRDSYKINNFLSIFNPIEAYEKKKYLNYCRSEKIL